MSTGLYIHVPFCLKKCIYCDFYSVPTGLDAPEILRKTFDRYLAALEVELSVQPDGFRPDTVFIGGGTPTLPEADQLRGLMGLIARKIDLSRVGEFTCEANPGTLTQEKIGTLIEGGVNRVSLGAQTFHNEFLRFLGRQHSAEDVAKSFILLRESGIENINLDLIYGIPGMPASAVAEDVDLLIQMKPEHAACYCLIFEENTPLFSMRQKGLVREVDDEAELDQYDRIRHSLSRAGYCHYEISNFARPGFECRHNLLYWSGGEYIGLGPAAHSHWLGERYSNVCNLDQYCRNLLAGQPARDFKEKLPADAKARETLVMSLRRLEGVDRAEFRRQTGFDCYDLSGGTIRQLIEEGLLTEDAGRLKLTERGLFLSDGVFAELV